MKKQFGFTALCLLVSLWAKPQYFSTGEDPASLKWRQIVTPDFQLIYPEEFEAKAHIMAAYFEKVYEYGSVTLHHKPRKISIIFHTRTVNSNGLVGWAPRRIELFTPPYQSIYAQDWLEQLVLHEFRHVVQVDKIHSEIPFIVKALLGEQGDALVTGLYLPFWFIEGDAVATETALSNSGRGRLPSFLMEQKAQVVEKGVFSYDKALNGSYRDYIPDRYHLGYLLVGETRARYGSDIWSHVMDRVARQPYSINPVNKTLKKVTGYNQQKLYESIFDSLRNVWNKEDQKYSSEHFRIMTSTSRGYQEYRYNHFLPSGEIISLKSGYDKIPRFVEIDKKGTERTVLVPGIIFDESVSYRNFLFTWSEYVPDLRWTHSGKSFIRIYNVKKRQMTTIRPDYKCFAPSISPDEHNVAVVETDFSNNYYLTVYSLLSGKLVTRYQTPGNNYLLNPVWKNNGELFVILLTEEGKRLSLIDPFSKKMEKLSETDMGEIKHLCVNGDKLCFISGYTGKNELYSMDLNSGQIKREVTARFGVEYPAYSADGNTLILSDYTSDGFRLISLTKDQIHPVPIHEVTNVTYDLAERLRLQEPGIVDFTNVDSVYKISRPYRKVLNLFNFHSWAPFSLDLQNYQVKPGVSLSSQNKLGTAQTTLGYRWNTSEKVGQYYVNFEYRGLYPILYAELNSGKRASFYYQVNVVKNRAGNVVSRDTVRKHFTWDQSEFSLDARIPFVLTRGKYYRIIQPEIKYNLTAYRHNPTTPDKFVTGNIQSVTWRVYYHQLMREAYRDLQPRWGWKADLAYRHSPFGDYDVGKLSSGELTTYWPGFLPHDGFSLYVGVQKRIRGEYSFSDVIALPKGWSSVKSNFVYSSSIRYSLPLFYPDMNLGKFIYIRRINASVFYDDAWLRGDLTVNGDISGTFEKKMNTVGAELHAEGNLLRFYAPVDAGFRTDYLPAIRKTVFEFLFSVNFDSF